MVSKNTQPPTDSIKNGRRMKGLDPKTRCEVGGTEQGETKCINWRIKTLMLMGDVQRAELVLGFHSLPVLKRETVRQPANNRRHITAATNRTLKYVSENI